MTISSTRWALIGLIVIAAALQINLVQRQSLWADEFFSLAMATGHSLEHASNVAQPQLGDFVEPATAAPAVEFQRYLQHENPPASLRRVVRAVILSDTSPPLYYILLYGWTLLFGTSDAALRLLSVSLSVASLPFLASVARRVAGNRAAIVSCALFAFSPLVIYYSTEGRMYSLLIFFALTTAWVSLVLQERGPHLGYCLLWIIFSAAGFLSHYFFVFPWVANVVFLFLQPGKLRRRWLLMCMLLVGLLILPWIATAAGAFSNWRVTKDWLYWRPTGFHRVRALLAQLLQFFSSEGHGLWRTSRWSTLLALGLFAVAAGVAIWRLRFKCFVGKRLLLWLWFFAGCIGPSVVDLLQHTYVSDVARYGLSAVPAACLLGGMVLSCCSRITGTILASLIVLAWLPGLVNLYRQRARCSEPVRQIAQVVDSTANDSDLVLVHSIPSDVIGLSRYVHTRAPIASWVGQLRNRRVPESLQTLARGRRRILLVRIHEVGEPVPEEDWLHANAKVFSARRFGAGELIDFRPLNSEVFWPAGTVAN